jgi:RHS repeat-associated protein
VSKSLPGGAGTLSYTYDSASNLTSATGPEGTTAYRYNQLNRLDQLTGPDGRKTVFAYNQAGLRTGTWYNSPTDATYDASGHTLVPPAAFAAHTALSYDADGRLTATRTTGASGATVLSDLSYSYSGPTACPGGPAGMTDKRQSVTDHLAGTTTTWCYDQAGRLASASTGGGPSYAYTYSLSGDRTSDNGGSYSLNSAGQLTGPGYAYDADGNMTSSLSLAFAYNGRGQATSATPAGGAPVAFAYSGTSQSERTAAGPTTYANGPGGSTSKVTGGVRTNWVREPGGALVSSHGPSGDYYFYFDGLGSVIGLVGLDGAQRASYTYGPYGEDATETAHNGPLPPNPWRWSGGYLDAATGLYHFGARYYDPAAGRFTQPDPVVGGSCTAYDYACGDPVDFTDTIGTKVRPLPPGPYSVCHWIGPVYDDIAFTSQACVHYRTAVANSKPSIYWDFIEKGQPYTEVYVSRIKVTPACI